MQSAAGVNNFPTPLLRDYDGDSNAATRSRSLRTRGIWGRSLGRSLYEIDLLLFILTFVMCSV